MNPLPELLAPAGDPRKLDTALAYGADAVYLAGPDFGLRARAGNFSLQQLHLARERTRRAGCRMYIALNMYPAEEDSNQLAPYLHRLQALEPDALIVSDPWVQHCAARQGFATHVSTQASVLNSPEARIWKERGATRIVLARELQLHQAARIARDAQIEIEIFVQGAMCMAYSGKCLLSNFMSKRDANRGGCAQSCRWFWQGTEPHPKASPLSSRDLCALELLPQICREPIAALKIEGRMKSPLYLAATTAAYRQALDRISQGIDPNWDQLRHILELPPNRQFCQGSLQDPAGIQSIANPEAHRGQAEYIGQVIAQDADRGLMECRAPLAPGEQAHLLRTDGTLHRIDQWRDLDNRPVEQLLPSRAYSLQLDSDQVHAIVLKYASEEQP